MKRILLSLAMIALVGSVSVGATRAYFSSDVTINNVTVATGTLHITDMNVDWMQQVSFTDLKPGSLIRKWLRIVNDGTLDVGVLTVSAVNRVDPNNLLGHLTGWTYGTIAGTSDDPNGVQTGYNTDASVLLNNANLLSPANPVLHPGQSTTIQVQFVVPTELGNEWQGRTATFNLLYHAEQTH